MNQNYNDKMRLSKALGCVGGEPQRVDVDRAVNKNPHKALPMLASVKEFLDWSMVFATFCGRPTSTTKATDFR